METAEATPASYSGSESSFAETEKDTMEGPTTSGPEVEWPRHASFTVVTRSVR